MIIIKQRLSPTLHARVWLAQARPNYNLCVTTYSARHHKLHIAGTSDDSGEFRIWSHLASQRLVGEVMRLRPPR